MDQELVREISIRYLSLATENGYGDAALGARTDAALALLRPVQTGSSGDLLEWYDERPGKEPGHRHVSHLYGLFPGSRIDEVFNPGGLRGRAPCAPSAAAPR